MMEKAKNDYKPRRSLLKKIMIFVGVGILAVFGLVLIFGLAATFILYQTASGELVEDLPLELVPTAKYLLKHPMPTPEYLFLNEPLTVEDAKGNQIHICVLKNKGAFFTSRFFVNGSRLPSERLESRELWLDPRDSTPLGLNVSRVCAVLPLEQGLYLIGFQPDVLALYPIHQWAIEIK